MLSPYIEDIGCKYSLVTKKRDYMMKMWLWLLSHTDGTLCSEISNILLEQLSSVFSAQLPDFKVLDSTSLYN